MSRQHLPIVGVTGVALHLAHERAGPGTHESEMKNGGAIFAT
jgi:hypothetical protein